MAAPSLAYYLLFYLYLHACAARPLQLSSKDLIMTCVDEEVVKHGNKASGDETNVVQMDSRKLTSVKEEDEKIEGKKVTTSYSWKILQQATGTDQIWKKAVRLMLEYPSPPSNAREHVRSKDGDTMEDVEVMDYAQPHRKPPIHNRPGT